MAKTNIGNKKTDKNSVSINTHGRTFVGTVIAAKMNKTATIEWNRTRYLPKYERTATERSRVKAHNPPEIDAKKGDIVSITECRPLSKTRHFIITEVMGQNRASPTFPLYAAGDRTRAGHRPLCSWPA